MDVIIIDRVTRKESILVNGISEKHAEQICEQWGWFYCDGNKTYWLSMSE